MQLFVLGAGIIAGIFLSGNKSAEIQKTESKSKTYSYASFIQKLGPVSAIIFGILLFALPLLAIAYTSPIIEIANIFFQSGALVFGGGHVVLPLLQSQLVPNGLISHTDFMAGYGNGSGNTRATFHFCCLSGGYDAYRFASLGIWHRLPYHHISASHFISSSGHSFLG
jgi:chromate transporter